MTARIGYGHLCLREENLNGYLIREQPHRTPIIHSSVIESHVLFLKIICYIYNRHIFPHRFQVNLQPKKVSIK
jgi:hypothetical protein